MNDEQQHRLQAWVDGQLDPKTAQEIARWVESEPDARQLTDNLRQVRQWVRDHEPVRRVPESREFYWSKIRKGIDAADAAKAVQEPARPEPRGADVHWWRWLIPAGVFVLVLLALRPGMPGPEVLAPVAHVSSLEPSAPQATVMSGHEIETPSAELSSLTFYSAQDAMTVVWVGNVDLL